MKPARMLCETNFLNQKIYVYITILCFALAITGCGEKNMPEAKLLGAAIHQHLAEKGICATPLECNQKLEGYGGHGNGVHWSYYGVKDRQALAVLIEFIIAHGIEITGGVPISITVYPKPYSEYGFSFLSPENIIRIQIKG